MGIRENSRGPQRRGGDAVTDRRERKNSLHDPQRGTVDDDSGPRTALAAASYTLVAAAQKASGFILLILFTRILSPTDYGHVALLTTVGALLVMALSLGLEPRIIYAYFQPSDGLAAYLRQARRVTVLIPVLASLPASLIAVGLSSPDLRLAWVMECLGSSFLAAGTTYAYSVLRATRRVKPYAVLALGILAAQVVSRVVLVAVFDLGPTGWAASDLAGGVAALALGYVVVGPSATQSDAVPATTAWAVLRQGLPLIPHYLAQWGLSLSDRLVLALYVTAAAIGYYSAMYQIAAVASLVLNEVNRAFMPLYANSKPQSAGLARLLRDHLQVTFGLHAAFVIFGFGVIETVLPPAYQGHVELFPILSVGALAYGLYFIPMNGLTLVAGITSRAPVISLTALGANLILNFALDSVWGLWGAVAATALGYLSLTGIALGFELRTRSLPWKLALRRHQSWGYLVSLAATVLCTWPGPLRWISLVTLTGLATAGLVASVRDVRKVRNVGLEGP